MGWRFKWVSSYRKEFNRDYRVSFTKEEMAKDNYYNYDTSGFPREEAPGISVFYQNGAGDIFHTYSCYARGGEFLIGAYGYLDLVPKGRDEDALPFTMAWIRHHDRYGGRLAQRTSAANYLEFLVVEVKSECVFVFFRFKVEEKFWRHGIQPVKHSHCIVYGRQIKHSIKDVSVLPELVAEELNCCMPECKRPVSQV